MILFQLFLFKQCLKEREQNSQWVSVSDPLGYGLDIVCKNISRWIAWRQPGTKEVLLHGWTPVLTIVAIVVATIVVEVVVEAVVNVVVEAVIEVVHATLQVLLAMLLSSAGGLILDFAVARFFTIYCSKPKASGELQEIGSVDMYEGFSMIVHESSAGTGN